MFAAILRKMGFRVEIWKLQGWDTFAGEAYDLEGSYFSEKAARRAAKRELKHLEKLQPSQDSGGQGPKGIQDRIFIIRPDGSSYRYLPEN
jgi:hypothetical protein